MAKRYNNYCETRNGEPYAAMEEHAEGEYVRYEDYEKLLDIVKKLSLCLDEGDDNGNQTHYVARGVIRAKGSFIALVQEATDVVDQESVE